MWILPSLSLWARAQSAACASWHPYFRSVHRFFSLAFLLSVFWKQLLFFCTSFYAQNLKRLISLCQTLGLSVSPSGCLPLSHILSLTLLPVVSKEGARRQRQVQRYPSPPGRLRTPLSKTQRPIFRTVSDKQDLCRVARVRSEGGRTGGWVHLGSCHGRTVDDAE